MFKRLVVLPLLFAALAGCSRLTSKLDAVIPDNRTEYRKSRTLPDLEVPPDLTTDAIRDRMAIPEGGAGGDLLDLPGADRQAQARGGTRTFRQRRDQGAR